MANATGFSLCFQLYNSCELFSQAFIDACIDLTHGLFSDVWHASFMRYKHRFAYVIGFSMPEMPFSVLYRHRLVYMTGFPMPCADIFWLKRHRERPLFQIPMPEEKSTIRVHICLGFLYYRKKRLQIISAAFTAPPVGLEPTTLRLTAACSTDWAKEDHPFLLSYLQNYIYKTETFQHSAVCELFGCFHSEAVIHKCSASTHVLCSRLGQALDRLVTVSSIHCCTSTSVLSTSSSSRGLTSF